MMDHITGGNCWRKGRVYNCPHCGVGNLCDVCHQHDEPRGECEQCPSCPACDSESK